MNQGNKAQCYLSHISYSVTVTPGIILQVLVLGFKNGTHLQLRIKCHIYSLSLLMLSEWFHFPDYTDKTDKDDSWQEARFSQYGFLIQALIFLNRQKFLMLLSELDFLKPKTCTFRQEPLLKRLDCVCGQGNLTKKLR